MRIESKQGTGIKEKLTPLSKKINRRNAVSVVCGAAMLSLSLVAAVNPEASAAFFSKLSSPNSASSAAVVPTPGPGAMTVYQVENANCGGSDLIISSNITDTLGFSEFVTHTVGVGSISQIHLRDLPSVPSPFTGAMTISADQPFIAEVVGYDYPSGMEPPPLTEEDLIRKVDYSGDGKITSVDIQYPAGRWNTGICDSVYVKTYDIVNGAGEPYPDGKIKTSDIQPVSGRWGMTYTLNTAAQTGALQRSLGLSPEVDLKLMPPNISVSPGGIFTVSLVAENVTDLAGFEALLKYNSGKLELLSIESGKTKRSMVSLNRKGIDGDVIGAYSQGVLPLGDDGDVTLKTFTFRAGVAGETSLMLADAEVNKRVNGGMDIRSIEGSQVLIAQNPVIDGYKLYVPVIIRLSRN